MDRPRLIGGLGWVAIGLALQAVYWLTGGPAGAVTAALVTVTAIAALLMAQRRRPQIRWWAGRIVAGLLGADFLAAVADRFGLLGAPGAPGVSWGDWDHFLRYTDGMLPAWAPAAVAAIAATAAELALGALLLAGAWWRWTGKLAAGLLTTYGVAMIYGYGWTSPLQYAVPVLIGAALLASARGGRSANRLPSRAGEPASSGRRTRAAARPTAQQNGNGRVAAAPARPSPRN
ncbi:hypothetical protein [Nakamurella aerolata]|uniref:hypothetical protein n=1 Tax=Nakamurella aerolata TaxID=1656892 RepID=UPI001BB14675|nr:hypothetical protein [Nakamurella aerolata]